MKTAATDALVSTDWLADHLSAPDVRVVDATWFLPAEARNARSEYDAEHIPGAVHFDIDDIADTNSTLPHMLPPPEKFSSKVRQLGLGNGNKIVVYDAEGFAAARVWWMFRVFGHQDVSVLDGGLGKWRREGRPVEDLPPVPRVRHFVSRINTLLVRDFDRVLANLDSRREQVVDARPAPRFRGELPEPRPGVLPGHIPGAINLPYTDMLDPADRTYLPVETLRARFAAAGIALDQPIVVSCGSGVSACIIALALHLTGAGEVAVYDGSWTEWGGRPDAPIERSA